MNELPTEIFNRIMILLPLGDKVEFMAVCKKWAHIIKTYCLLETIRITSINQLNRIVKKLECESLEAKQMERLILNITLPSNFDLIHFFNQFPNLRVIFMIRSKSTQFQAMTTPSENNRIESIVDLGGYTMPSYFLTSNKCAHLKRVEVYSHIRKPESDNFVNLFTRLSTLNTLSLAGIDITFKDLEALHTSLPSLLSLTLSDFEINDSDLPVRIEPATSITIINISIFNTDLRMKTIFFQYAKEKYTNILDLKVYILIKESRQEEVDQFYNEGMVPFIQPLVSRLERCDLEMNKIPENVHSILDKINLNIKWAHIYLTDDEINSGLERCIRTNQASCIKEISIKSDREIDFSMLKGFSVLKRINVSYSSQNGKAICVLNDILKMCCNSVKIIDISGALVKFDSLDSQKYENIKDLTFNFAYLDRNIDLSIEKYLPNLHCLDLYNCYLPESKFFLSNLNLLTLSITRPYHLENNRFVEAKQLNLLVCTRNNNQRRIWIANSNVEYDEFNIGFEYSDHSAYLQVRSLLYDNTRLCPTLTFNLASVKKVFVKNSYNQSKSEKENIHLQ